MKLNLKLNRRYPRNIKRSIIFYIAASLLTMLCVMSFALLYTCGVGIKNYVNDIFEKNVVEDANVETLTEISDEDIETYERDYHMLMEKQEYLNILNAKILDNNGKDVTAKNTLVRVFKENFKINKYTITALNKGLNYTSINDLQDDEIIINEKYATKHNITLDNNNNRIILGDKEFRVVGFFVRPDYLYGLINTTDSYPNYDAFLLAYVNDNVYNDFKDDSDGQISSSVIYSLKYDIDGKTDVDALRNNLFNEAITYQYNASATSGRIKTFYNRPKMYISFAFLALVIMPGLVVSIISIILSIKVKNDQKIIGTISALGYRDSEICYHYSILAMIPGIIGGILMTIIVYITAGYLGKLSTGDYEVMAIKYIYPWYAAVLGIVLPTFIYTLAAILTVKRLINRPITALLRGAGRESKSSNLLVNKRMKITSKFAFRSLVLNGGRTFVVFLGILASTLVITLSLMQFDSISAIVSQAMKKAGDFEYEYTLKMPDIAAEEDMASEEYNYMIATVYEYNDRKIPLMGASTDNMNLWYTTLTDGTKVTTLNRNSFYVSKLCAELMHIKKGDKVKIYSNFNKDELEFTVSGIIDNGLISYILTSKEVVISSYYRTIMSLLDADDTFPSYIKDILNDYFDNEETTGLENIYNIVLSKNVLDDRYDSANLVNVFQKSSIETQKEAKLKERAVIIYTVLVIGVLICIISVFTVVNVIIDDNQANISMMRVLGYKPKEINKMIISGYHYVVPLGIMAGIPLAYAILSAYFKRAIPNNNLIVPTTISYRSIIIIVFTITITYILTLLILSTKASKVNMTDSLKDNR